MIEPNRKYSYPTTNVYKRLIHGFVFNLQSIIQFNTQKRKLLIICSANLRKQWNQELADKFFIPSTVLESKSFNKLKKEGKANPFEQDSIILSSFQFIRSKEQYVKMVNWDLVIIDEAHRLRRTVLKSQ